MARAFCHEIDHLDGVLFVDKVERFISRDELERDNEEIDDEERGEEG